MIYILFYISIFIDSKTSSSSCKYEETINFDQVYIHDCFISNIKSDSKGGCFFLENKFKVIIKELMINNCSSKEMGGALYIISSDELIISNLCAFNCFVYEKDNYQFGYLNILKNNFNNIGISNSINYNSMITLGITSNNCYLSYVNFSQNKLSSLSVLEINSKKYDSINYMYYLIFFSNQNFYGNLSFLNIKTYINYFVVYNNSVLKEKAYYFQSIISFYSKNNHIGNNFNLKFSRECVYEVVFSFSIINNSKIIDDICQIPINITSNLISSPTKSKEYINQQTPIITSIQTETQINLRTLKSNEFIETKISKMILMSQSRFNSLSYFQSYTDIKIITFSNTIIGTSITNTLENSETILYLLSKVEIEYSISTITNFIINIPYYSEIQIVSYYIFYNIIINNIENNNLTSTDILILFSGISFIIFIFLTLLIFFIRQNLNNEISSESLTTENLENSNIEDFDNNNIIKETNDADDNWLKTNF